VAKEVGGEPLVVGKIAKTAEGKMKFMPITEATAAPPSSSSGAVAAPVPKKKDSGSGSASGTGGVAKSKP
jgi:hypothetical protein